MPQPAGPPGLDLEVAALKERYAGLRQAAALPGADARAVLEAAFAELDTAVDVLGAMRAGPATGSSQPGGPGPEALAHGAAAAARGVPGRARADVPAWPGRHRAAGQHQGRRAARIRPRVRRRQALHRVRGPARPGRGAKPVRRGRAHRQDPADPVPPAAPGRTSGHRADRRAGPGAGRRRPARGGGQRARSGRGPRNRCGSGGQATIRVRPIRAQTAQDGYRPRPRSRRALRAWAWIRTARLASWRR